MYDGAPINRRKMHTIHTFQRSERIAEAIQVPKGVQHITTDRRDQIIQKSNLFCVMWIQVHVFLCPASDLKGLPGASSNRIVCP